MDNIENLMALLPVILGILIVGIIVLSGWLIWVFTRRRDTQPNRPVDNGNTPATGSQSPYYLLGVKPGEAGAWEIYVQGIRYPDLTQVPDPQIRTAVVQAVAQVVRFVGQAADSMRLSPTDIEPPRAQRGSSARLASETTEPTTRRTAAPDSLMPVIDFAHEITDIIENLQRQTPELQAHAVSLQNVPGGGINFLVDGKIYRDLADIPFPEIQTLIRRATQAWEQQ